MCPKGGAMGQAPDAGEPRRSQGGPAQHSTACPTGYASILLLPTKNDHNQWCLQFSRKKHTHTPSASRCVRACALTHLPHPAVFSIFNCLSTRPRMFDCKITSQSPYWIGNTLPDLIISIAEVWQGEGGGEYNRLRLCCKSHHLQEVTTSRITRISEQTSMTQKWRHWWAEGHSVRKISGWFLFPSWKSGVEVGRVSASSQPLSRRDQGQQCAN